MLSHFPFIIAYFLFIISFLSSSPAQAQEPQPAYRPFIEKNKVWKVGLFPSQTEAAAVELYYFNGDTLLDGHLCSKWKCERIDQTCSQTTIFGYVYEQQQRVYFFSYRGCTTFSLLYDFAAEVGQNVAVWDSEQCVEAEGVVTRRDICERPTGDIPVTVVDFPGRGTSTWYQGIGTLCRPCVSVPQLPEDVCALMLCTVEDEVLYHNPELTENLSGLYLSDNDTRVKQRLDFTHVVKTRPKAPLRVCSVPAGRGQADTASAASAMPAASAASAVPAAEYDDLGLSINLQAMQGTYTVTVRNQAAEPLFCQQADATTLERLTINLQDYPLGAYDLVIENQQEQFSTAFSLPLHPNNVRTTTAAHPRPHLHDLTGRRLTRRPAHGLFIQDGHLRHR